MNVVKLCRKTVKKLQNNVKLQHIYQNFRKIELNLQEYLIRMQNEQN